MNLFLISVVVFSFSLHTFTRRIVQLYTCSQWCNRFFPANCILDAKYHWEWCNTAVSFLHAIVTAIWALSSFFLYPEFTEDLSSTHSSFMSCLISYSLGYFIYDSYDLLSTPAHQFRVDYLVHHVIIFLCFGSALFYDCYVGYAVVSLLAEVNSSFLHARKLLNILKYPRLTKLSQTIRLSNIGTFVVFRLVLFSWMTRWLVVNRDTVPLGFYILGAISLAAITLMNISYLIRIVQADVLRNANPAAAASWGMMSGAGTGSHSCSSAQHGLSCNTSCS